MACLFYREQDIGGGIFWDMSQNMIFLQYQSSAICNPLVWQIQASRQPHSALSDSAVTVWQPAQACQQMTGGQLQDTVRSCRPVRHPEPLPVQSQAFWAQRQGLLPSLLSCIADLNHNMFPDYFCGWKYRLGNLLHTFCRNMPLRQPCLLQSSVRLQARES